MALVAIPFALASPRSGGRAVGIGVAIVIAGGTGSSTPWRSRSPRPICCPRRSRRGPPTSCSSASGPRSSCAPNMLGGGLDGLLRASPKRIARAEPALESGRFLQPPPQRFFRMTPPAGLVARSRRGRGLRLRRACSREGPAPAGRPPGRLLRRAFPGAVGGLPRGASAPAKAAQSPCRSASWPLCHASQARWTPGRWPRPRPVGTRGCSGGPAGRPHRARGPRKCARARPRGWAPSRSGCCRRQPPGAARAARPTSPAARYSGCT